MGDDDSGDSLVDENEPIQPLQALETEDYNDPNWDPEPIDAGPGERVSSSPVHQINAKQAACRLPHEQAE